MCAPNCISYIGGAITRMTIKQIWQISPFLRHKHCLTHRAVVLGQHQRVLIQVDSRKMWKWKCVIFYVIFTFITYGHHHFSWPASWQNCDSTDCHSVMVFLALILLFTVFTFTFTFMAVNHSHFHFPRHGVIIIFAWPASWHRWGRLHTALGRPGEVDSASRQSATTLPACFITFLGFDHF